MSRQQQIEREMDHQFKSKYGVCRISYKYIKTRQHRRERRRVKEDPDCNPEYNKYDGYVW